MGQHEARQQGSRDFSTYKLEIAREATCIEIPVAVANGWQELLRAIPLPITSLIRAQFGGMVGSKLDAPQQ